LAVTTVNIDKLLKALSGGGAFACEYGTSGVGKTLNGLLTLPRPVMWIPTEPRDLTRPIKTAMHIDKSIKSDDIIITTLDNSGDKLDFFNDVDKFSKVKSILYDGLTFDMAMNVSDDVIDQAHEARISKKDVGAKELSSKVKGTIEGQGITNNIIKRILSALGRLATNGKFVVVTCLEDDKPKWDRSLTGAPSLSGKEIPKLYDGFFDLIGRVVHKYDKEGKKMYPPEIVFEESGEYTAKWTGVWDLPMKQGKNGLVKVCDLNWSKIFGVVK
jgi:hypothetical protein